MFPQKTLRSFSLLGLIMSGALATGCASTAIEQLSDASWANRVTTGTQVNPSGRVLQDAESAEETIGKGKAQGLGLDNLALGGAFAMAPKGAGSIPALDALLFLDILSDSGTPDQAFYQHNTLAWFPANQATSPADARDKYHEMRLNALKAKLDSVGAKYEQKGFSLMRNIVAGSMVRTDNLILNDGAKGLCDSCVIVVVTAVPESKPVMAPKELTGESFLAYRFAGSKEAGSGRARRTYTEVRWKRVVDKDEKYWAIWKARDYDQLAWVTETYPAWAVEFVPKYKPEMIARINAGQWPDENPFPFVVHKGQVKHFIRGQ